MQGYDISMHDYKLLLWCNYLHQYAHRSCQNFHLFHTSEPRKTLGILLLLTDQPVQPVDQSMQLTGQPFTTGPNCILNFLVFGCDQDRYTTTAARSVKLTLPAPGKATVRTCARPLAHWYSEGL
jgi:hypothetical protein